MCSPNRHAEPVSVEGSVLKFLKELICDRINLKLLEKNTFKVIFLTHERLAKRGVFHTQVNKSLALYKCPRVEEREGNKKLIPGRTKIGK